MYQIYNMGGKEWLHDFSLKSTGHHCDTSQVTQHAPEQNEVL